MAHTSWRRIELRKEGGAMRKKKNPPTPVGLAVKKRLLDLNLSQRDLAERLDVGESYVSMILSGERNSSDFMEKILNEIGLDGNLDLNPAANE